MDYSVSQIWIGRTKIVFGRNSLSTLPNELKMLRVSKPLLLTDAVLERLGMADAAKTLLRENGIPFVTYAAISPDPNSRTVAAATDCYRQNACDGVIGLGGGSVMDTAKCVAAMANNAGSFLDYDFTNPEKREFQNDCVPLICIPTTSGTGAEVSRYAVITNEQTCVKSGASSSALLSHTAIVDPVLTMGLPRNATAACGCDALAHCIEGFTSTKSLHAPNPIIDALALEGISLLYRYLPRAVTDGADMEAREMVAWAATIGGIALQYGSGAAHGVSNVIGGTHHVPHGNAIAMLLPYVLRYNLPACRERYGIVAARLGMRTADGAIEALAQMIEQFRLPRLAEYVENAAELHAIAKLVVQDKCTRYNGRRITEADAQYLLECAY